MRDQSSYSSPTQNKSKTEQSYKKGPWKFRGEQTFLNPRICHSDRNYPQNSAHPLCTPVTPNNSRRFIIRKPNRPRHRNIRGSRRSTRPQLNRRIRTRINITISMLDNRAANPVDRSRRIASRRRRAVTSTSWSSFPQDTCCGWPGAIADAEYLVSFLAAGCEGAGEGSGEEESKLP